MSTSTSSKRIRTKKSKKALGITGVPDDDELKYLEKIILGTGTEVFQKPDSDSESEEETPKKKAKDSQTNLKKPAWVDEDDNLTFGQVVKKQERKCKLGKSGSKKYQVVTGEKFQKVMGIPKWAEQKEGNEDPSDDLLRRCGKLLNKPNFLSKGDLDIKKVVPLNSETRSEGPLITVVKFHPKSTVAMVAGVSGIVSLFQVDGKRNTKLQSIQFQKYPINCGVFINNGEEFLIGSQYYRYFYSHNLMTGQSKKIDNGKLIDITKTKNFCVSPNDDIIAVCGNRGRIFLFAASTKEYIDSFQMNGSVNALDFNSDGSVLYSFGEDGQVYMWDMNARRCIKKFFDDGCLKGTSIAMSDNDQFLACGSSSGIVNVYNSNDFNSDAQFLPIKTIYNLVTPITSVRFNSSGEILAMASNLKGNAVKLVHCPSMTVFKNFPAFQSKMKKPNALDFSPNSGYFSVGDHEGTAHLFRLKYYGNY